jgi:hypothetical protein
MTILRQPKEGRLWIFSNILISILTHAKTKQNTACIIIKIMHADISLKNPCHSF